MLKTLSLIGYIGMMDVLLGLLVMRNLFSSSTLVICVHLGGRGGALVLEQRFVGYADSGERGDANLLRGTVGGGTLS
jgi:hypothetical protein